MIGWWPFWMGFSALVFLGFALWFLRAARAEDESE